MTSEPKELAIPAFLRRFGPIILLALLPLIPLYRTVFFGQSIGPFDQIRQMAPWNGPKPSQPWDVLQADGVLQFYVWRDLVFDFWGKGQIPFWNSYQLAGTPLLANSQSGAMYPPHVLMGLLHVPTGMAMTLLAWFHLFWAGLGAYHLSKVLGANQLGATIAGASFTLSSFMVAWTGLPSVIETVAWIPWVLATTLLLFEKRKALPYIPWLGVSIGMMILAGHLQFVAYGFIALALLLVWLVATRWKLGRVSELRSVGQVGLAALLGVCIAGPQLLPALQFGQFSHRKNTPTAQGYAAYVDGAIQSYELSKIIAPNLQGNPRETYDEKLPVSTYYPALLKPGASFTESAIGLGVFVVLLLAVLPLLAKRTEPVWGVLAVGLVGLLLALGTPLDQLLYFGVPGWSSTGSPGRAICLFVLAGCCGAGVAASRLPELLPLIKEKKPALIAAGCGLLIFVIVLFACNGAYSIRKGLDSAAVDSIVSHTQSSAMPGVLGVTLLSLLAVGLALKERSHRSMALLISVPMLSGIAFLDTVLIQTGNPDDLRIKSDVGNQRIAAINGTWDMFLASHALLPPNTAALNRIHSIDGYDSLMDRDSVNVLRDIDGDDPATKINGNMMLIAPTADFDKLAAAGVTEVWSTNAIPKLGAKEAVGGVFKYHLNGPGRASTPQGPAEIVSESGSQLMLRAKGPGRLVVRERNMPGWLAKVDGRHVALQGTPWMEMDLPAGEHNIELNYVPPGFMPGVFMAVVGWLTVLLLALWRRMRLRRHQNAS